jgi:hypothetical protein
MIQHARADATGLAPIYIVEPPSIGAMRSELSAEFEDSQQLEKQPIISRVVLSGPTLMPKQLEAWELERQDIKKKNLNRFYGYMTKGLAELRALNSAMRMRVHLGNIHLLYYRKELKEEGYTFEKFSGMMQESRTKANFEKM